MKYDKTALIPKILDHISDGKSIRAVSKLEGMPSKSVITLWLNEPENEGQYARAREERELCYFEDVLDIAKNVAPERDEVAKARLEIDAIKWALGKMNPKKYGDKITQELTGEGGADITFTIKDMSK